MGVVWTKRIGLGLLALFFILNLFLYASSQWNSDRIPGMGNWRVLSVLTGSMSPTIDAGDMVIVSRYIGKVPQTGDIVTYWKDDQSRSLITHRVIMRLENGYLQTKGDANHEADGGWTDPNRLVGQVVYTIPYAAALQQLLKEPLMMLLILSGFLIFVVYTQRRSGAKQDLKPASVENETIEGELT
ncbi:signal peptidase I [Brevibacillus choshinensis]|uniref:Signal peptidase I n=1 Tax=Brevibacillus choshinensis TaxID=54911 RepID=A0ABX7FS71_BRECH|nr:signal peptidase I [Brevibacillus choshinensis]QRG68107.1 signal peptidase I [Brevibacillus choshinensis]